MRVGLCRCSRSSRDLGRQRDVRARALPRARPGRGRTSTRRSSRRSRRTPASGLPTVVADGYPTLDDDAAGGCARWRSAWLRPGALRRAARAALDVVHYPLTVPVPPAREPHGRSPCSTSSTSTCPELFPRGERLFRRLAYDRARARRRRVIVISEFVRERGRSSGSGSTPSASTRSTSASTTSASRPTRRVEREPFLLYPARPWPHKNHARLFEAFALRAPRRGRSCGSCSPGVGHDAAALPDGVEARGGVSADELVELYRRAAASSSRASTRASGCRRSRRWPAAARSPRPTPGRCPRCAATRPSSSTRATPEAIAAGVTEALDRADELRQRGLARAAAFTWDATARAHDRVYEAALSCLKPHAVGLDQQPHELVEVDRRLPAEDAPRLRRVADEVVELGGAAVERRVAPHVRRASRGRRASNAQLDELLRPSATRRSRRRSRPARPAAASATSRGRSRRHTPSRGAQSRSPSTSSCSSPSEIAAAARATLRGRKSSGPPRRLVVVEDPAAA